MTKKLTITALIVAVFCGLEFLLSVYSTLQLGDIGAAQLAPSDTGYVQTQSWIYILKVGQLLLTAGLSIGLFAVWRHDLYRLIEKIRESTDTGGTAALLVAIGTALIAVPDARAYYEKSDWPEEIFILPNETLFWIPDVGDNAKTQVRFGSEEYLAKNKVAAKRFRIPHAKVPGSSWTTDYYGPAGRAIIVDRTPYARLWTKSSARGSAKDDQALECQTKEGANVTAEISIAASVTEEQAAKFLYWFGVKPLTGDRTDKKVAYTSVLYAYTLTTVMDNVVRGKIQAIVCKQFAIRNLDRVNSESAKIMDDAHTEVSEFMESRGITLNYIGWGGTFSFDSPVQQAINDRLVAEKVRTALPILHQLANVHLKERLGAGIELHGLPKNLVVIPDSLLAALSAIPQLLPAPAPVVEPVQPEEPAGKPEKKK